MKACCRPSDAPYPGDHMSPTLTRMLHRIRGLVLLGALVLAVPACAPLSPAIGDMTRAYSESIEIHERNQILKNILRSGDDMSMSFQTVPTIVGTGLLEGNAGLSGMLAGSILDGASATVSLKSARGFNFTLASLDNEKFTSAFLRDIPLETINVFSSGDFDRQLLLTLVLQSITLNPGRPGAERLLNNAQDRDAFGRFQATVSHLVAAGLRTEVVQRLTPIGTDLSRDELLRHYYNAPLGQAPDIRVMQLDNAQGTPTFRLVRVSRATRFCLSTTQYETLTGLKLPAALNCRPAGLGGLASGSELIAGESLNPEAQGEVLNFNIRSTRDVYRFVGLLAGVQEGSHAWRPTIRLSNPETGLVARDHPLIVVQKGPPPSGARVLAVAEHMGSTYHVPYDEAGLSRRVFEYLSLLLSTSMVKDAIPTSPGILVR